MKIGFIGLGIMGKPMSKNLISAGHELVVSDINEDAVREIVSQGAIAAESAAAVAMQCGVIITMLPNSPHVRQAVLGENGIIEGATGGSVLIDMSSIDPMESRSIAALLSKRSIEMLDAPVSGGQPKAVDGTLSVMVGGKQELFERYHTLLGSMASSVVYVGEIGSGNIAKLANQIIVALNIAAVGEAFSMVTKLGADPEAVYRAICGGLAGSTVMDAKVPLILSRNFAPGFRIELHIKDLNNALNAAHAVQAPIPLAAQIMEMMQALASDGLQAEDHCSLVKYYEKLSGVTIAGKQA